MHHAQLHALYRQSGPQRRTHTLHDFREAPRPTTISKLPPEILSAIFEHLYLSDMLDHSNPYEPLYLVAQVCRSWRDVCFDAPHLWSHIYAHVAPDYAELLLARSKAARLHLHCHSLIRPQVVEMVYQNAHRLKTMDIDHLEHIHDATTSTLISRLIDAPLLHALHVRYHDHIVGLLTKVVHLTHKAAIQSDSQLRHLSLSNCLWNISTPFFSNLRSLKIIMSYPINNVLPTIDLLSALSAMHFLETLEVSYIAESSTAHHENQVFLPFLTEITMKRVDIPTLNILSRLACPRIRTIALATPRLLSAATFQPAASAVFNMIPRASPWHVEAIIEPFSSGCHSVFLIWPEPKTEERYAPFVLDMIGPNTFEDEQLLYSLLPPNTGLELHFKQYNRHCDKLNIACLKPFLRALKNVHEIHVSDLRALISLISDTPRVSKKTRAGILPEFALPSLSVIWLEQSTFKPPCLKLGKVASLLQRRRDIGAGISTLKLGEQRRGHSSPAELPVGEELKAFVGTIEQVTDPVVKSTITCSRLIY